LGYNIHEYYVFIQKNISQSTNKKTSVHWCYRWIVSKNISSEELEHSMSDVLSYEKNYTRVDIEKLSEIVGASVYERNNFKTYSILGYSFGEDQKEYRCIINKNK
jgi:hypothetical protein